MLNTIKHQDSGKEVVVAKLLTGYLKVTSKVDNKFISENELFNANFTAYMVGWQGNHNVVPDGVIGPDTWTAISKRIPTCSTSKNRISGYTLALQILLDSNIECDGIFGARTKAAVVAFQVAKGLSADGICGPKTWNALIVGTEESHGCNDDYCDLSDIHAFKQPVDYKQGKPEWWASYNYTSTGNKKQTMANSGCGPTAAADVMATLIDPAINPWTLAQLAMKWGDRTPNSGTDWSFFQHLADYYGFGEGRYIKTASFEILKACLDAGGYVVCSMAPGYWTKQGHFICCWKYDSANVYCNDPASTERKKQNISDFKKERKQFFCYYPKKENKVSEPVEEEPITVEPTKKEIARGEKICDISKWKPNVDYDKFIADTKLIILRAGSRKPDGKIYIDDCFEKHANGLKSRGVDFGVFFYSIANTAEKAREEARAFVSYAKKYEPLFWAMDAEDISITTEAIGAFADELHALEIKRIGCYVANEKYIDPYNFASVKDKYDFTWIPKYRSTPPMHMCDIWQYTSKGRVDGINEDVDLNKITGEGKSIEWFLDRSIVMEDKNEDDNNVYVLITGNTVNVRNAPGINSDIIGIARVNSKYPYKNENTIIDGMIWYKIDFDYKIGWVSSKYAIIA